jgi:hypothetical protein
MTGNNPATIRRSLANAFQVRNRGFARLDGFRERSGRWLASPNCEPWQGRHRKSLEMWWALPVTK